MFNFSGFQCSTLGVSVVKKTLCFPVVSAWPFSSLLDVPTASEKARLEASLVTEWVVPGVLSSEAHLETKEGSSQG